MAPPARKAVLFMNDTFVGEANSIIDHASINNEDFDSRLM